MAYRIGEDRRALLPVMVNLDGFSVSHVVEPIEFLTQEEADEFLPPFGPPFRLDPDRPLTFGAYGMPEIYTEAKFAQEMAIRAAKAVVKEVMEEFGRRFGRSYSPVEVFGEPESADCTFLALGSINENIKSAIEAMSKEGKKAALLALRLFRPFPFEELEPLLRRIERLAIIERVMPAGAPNGPVYAECASSLYGTGVEVILGNYVVGLGGRDVPVHIFRAIYEDMMAKKRTEGGYKVMGVRR
jgi:pyruvate ferredoxin oxidoreductase alpha subunit